MQSKVITALIFVAALSGIGITQQAAAQTTRQPTQSATRRTIFVPAMDGLEKDVVRALSAEQSPVEVVTDQANSDLQVKPSLSTSLAPIAVTIYRKQFGHDPFSLLKVVETKGNRNLLTYRFIWANDQASRASAAREFAEELRKKLVTK
jgi:hypothetical protein